MRARRKLIGLIEEALGAAAVDVGVDDFTLSILSDLHAALTQKREAVPAISIRVEVPDGKDAVGKRLGLAGLDQEHFLARHHYFRAKLRQQASDPGPDGHHHPVEDRAPVVMDDPDIGRPLVYCLCGRPLQYVRSLTPRHVCHDSHSKATLDVSGPAVVYANLVSREAQQGKALSSFFVRHNQDLVARPRRNWTLECMGLPGSNRVVAVTAPV